MIVVRNVFRCKPGQAKKLVGMFQEMAKSNPQMPKSRVLTDVAAGFWTVVFETEAESLSAFEATFAAMNSPEARRPMEGYMDLVESGYREIFKIE